MLDFLEIVSLIVLGVFFSLLCYLIVVYVEREPIRREREEVLPPHREEIEERLGRIDRLFDVALVLITVFSATTLTHVVVKNEFQNAMRPLAERNMANVDFSFKVVTIPLVVLIVLWLTRGLVPSHRRILLVIQMVLRQFCWAFFSILFVFVAVLFAYSLLTQSSYELLLYQNWLSFLLYPINALAMWNYAKRIPEFPFFRSRMGLFIWTILGPGTGQFVSWAIIMLLYMI